MANFSRQSHLDFHCVCVGGGAHACAWLCMWRPEACLGCCFLGAVYLVWGRLSHSGTWNKQDWLAWESQDTPHITKAANMPVPSLQPQYSESLCWWCFQKFVLKGLCLQYQRFSLSTLNFKVVIRRLFTSSLLLVNQSTAVPTLFFALWLKETTVALTKQSPMWCLIASSLLRVLFSGTHSQTWAQGRSNTRCWRHGVLSWKLGTTQDGAQRSHPKES